MTLNINEPEVLSAELLAIGRRYYPTLSPSRNTQIPTESHDRFDSPRQDSITCEALRAETDNINTRMRHGYGAKEDNYWNDQLHRISSQQYDLNCAR